MRERRNENGRNERNERVSSTKELNGRMLRIKIEEEGGELE